MTHLPSPNGDNGRGAGGRFTKGNSGGPGAPHAGAVGRLRAVMIAAVSDADMAAIVRVLVKEAMTGNIAAIKEVLDRTVGKSQPFADADDAAANGKLEIIVRHVSKPKYGDDSV